MPDLHDGWSDAMSEDDQENPLTVTPTPELRERLNRLIEKSLLYGPLSVAPDLGITEEELERGLEEASLRWDAKHPDGTRDYTAELERARDAAPRWGETTQEERSSTQRAINDAIRSVRGRRCE